MGKQFVLFGIFVLLNIFPSVSQEDEISDGFSYRSFSITPLGIYVGSNTGVAISGDVSVDYGKNIFRLAIGAGTESNFYSKSEDFTEVNFLYGRSFLLSEKIFTDLFVGAGYFHFNAYESINKIGRIAEKKVLSVFQLGLNFNLC